MAQKSHNSHVLDLLSGKSSPTRFLIVSLSAIILLIALARVYLFVEYRGEVTRAVNRLSISSSRNSLVLSAYQLALDSYGLAERFVRNPSERTDLKHLYTQNVERYKASKESYLNLQIQTQEQSEEHIALVNQFFVRTDSLLSAIEGVLNARVSPAGKVLLPAEAESLFHPGINDYFRRLRKSWEALNRFEVEMNAREFSSGEEYIRSTTNRWFEISGLLLLVAVAMVLVVILLVQRATSLVRQLSTVLEHNVNPIQIADEKGTLLYVNSEFERWSGTAKNDLIGSRCFDGIRLLQDRERRSSVWEVVSSSFAVGETWAGEVEVQRRNGATSVSSLIVLPVFNRQGRLQQVISLFHDASEKKRLAQEVEEARRQYENLVENSLDGIVVVQRDRLVFVNPAVVRIFEYGSRDEMERVGFIDTVAPASRPFLRLEYQDKSQGDDLLQNYEFKGLTKQGKLIDLEMNARVIVWNGTKAMLASIRNITERKSLERQQAVWMWEQETLSSIDRQLLGIVDLQKVLAIILQQVTLLTRCQFVGVVMVDAENRQATWRTVKGNRVPLAGNVVRMTADAIAAFAGGDHFVQEDCRSGNDSSVVHLQELVSEGIASAGYYPLLVNGQPRGKLIVGFRQPHKFGDRENRVLMSMAEKVSIALTSGELYENLLQREKELELLSGARVQAQEDEKRRISREIHDGLGQLLTAIKFNLEILEDSIPAREDATKRIHEVKQMLDNVMKEAREISYNLMPSVLDDFGLGAGLQSLCEQFAKGTGLKISFHEHGLTERLNGDLEIGLYRIAQEALNNIAKHAEAKEVELQIVRHASKLQMTVEDDGKGMGLPLPAGKASGSGGTGLVGMRERAASFSGTLLIDSTPGKGTMISIEIPLEATR